jgi:hypothetical protein
MKKAEVENLIKTGKHFCVLPWIHFHAWPDGKVMPCCVADSSKPVSQVKSDESIIQMMNSEDYKKMRLAMLNDEPVEACNRCYEIEKLGTWTMRQSHNKRRGMEYVDIIKDTKKDGGLKEFQLKYMDIRFSNLCNMKCRTCGPGCSSQWSQEIVNIKGKEHFEKYYYPKVIINNNEDQTFLAKLKPYLKDVQEVYFAGGEVIITPEHYECLDYWIENGLNEQIELTYTTNFSVLKYKDKNLIEYWKKFPKLRIWASLDAQGDVAELVRKGTDWKKIARNLKKVRELVPHAQFQITPTISIYNVFQFPKFFDWLVEEGFIDIEGPRWYDGPRFNLCTGPWYMDIKVLPEHVKKKLSDIYYEYQMKYDKRSFNGFRMIKYALDVGGENKEAILEFKKYNEELDGYRAEDMLKTIPELKEVYEWAES